MLTPKLYRQLGEILLQEIRIETPDYALYVPEALAGRPFPLGGSFRLSANGRLEALRPTGPKAYPVRLLTRAVIRTITRAAQSGIPVGASTKEWMQSALRAEDFREEAQACLEGRLRQGELLSGSNGVSPRLPPLEGSSRRPLDTNPTAWSPPEARAR
jgi:hypothetical protein